MCIRDRTRGGQIDADNVNISTNTAIIFNATGVPVSEFIYVCTNASYSTGHGKYYYITNTHYVAQGATASSYNWQLLYELS